MLDHVEYSIISFEDILRLISINNEIFEAYDIWQYNNSLRNSVVNFILTTICEHINLESKEETTWKASVTDLD